MLYSMSSPFCQHIIMIKTDYHDNMFELTNKRYMIIAYPDSQLQFEQEYTKTNQERRRQKNEQKKFRSVSRIPMEPRKIDEGRQMDMQLFSHSNKAV